MLGLFGGVIAAHEWVYVESDDELGIAARCDDGTQEFYVDKARPTFRDVFAITVADTAPYEEKRKAVLEATGWEFPEEFRWLNTDEEGAVIPGTDTDETLTRWLNSEVGYSDDYSCGLQERWSSYTSTIYGPGFALMNALTDADAKELGLRYADLGGPASSVPCVASTATIEKLNQVLSAKGLPFVFVEEVNHPPS
jgi:hypothetical protein